MIKSFNAIKSRRTWLPISISHLFQQGPFSSWPLLFLHLGCFCLDYNCKDIWGEPKRAPYRSVVDACVVRTSHAQKFTLRTRKAPHWLVVDACVVRMSRARRSTI